MDYFFSIDVGTTAVKIVLFDSYGNVIAVSIKEYSLLTPSEDIVELCAETYWEYCKEGIAEVLSKSKVSTKKIKSIGICSQGETLIALDKDSKPLRNAIVWMDNRSKKEAEDIRNTFGTESGRRITGQPDAIPEWPITKILWLKRNEPRLFEKIRKFLLVEDYLLYHMTGEFNGEYSLYSSSYMLDIVKKKWWAEILEYAGISPEFLVNLCESGEIIGCVSDSVCSELGLSPDTKVVTGAMDQTSALIGAGNIETGMVTETTGAALAVCATIDSFPSYSEGAIAVQYHAIPDMYLFLGWCPTGGMALKWLRDTFFVIEREEMAKLKRDNYNFLTNLAEESPIGSEGLIFLPYLAGAGTPKVNSNTRGVFYGLDLHHNRNHFVRAVMESVGFVLRQNIEEMEKTGTTCREIRSLGGGSKSLLWNQIKADITGRPIITMECPEAASLGTAMLQAKALGIYSNLKEAADNMVRVSSKVEPSEEGHKMYEVFYQKFLHVDEYRT